MKLTRVRSILGAVGNPQRHYPIVHITGTSGKGSTAATVAAILSASGYRVGLRTSPYLQVATEKLQIGRLLIDPRSFEMMVSQVLAAAVHLDPSARSSSRISYAEAWAVLGFWWFAERQVDIAVVEVAAGGRFDATNVIDPVVSVITSVGLDHLVTLGPSIPDIAWHKAGIIKPGAPVVIGNLPSEALAIIAREANRAKVKLVRASDTTDSRSWLPGMSGEFQRRNTEVAVGVVRSLAQQGFVIPDAAIGEGISAARLPGRLEQMPNGNDPTIWIDGAHNADKIAALASEAARLAVGGSLPTVVLGVLNTKDPTSIVAGLRHLASSTVLTEPRIFGKRSLAASALADILIASGYQGEVHIEPNPDTAVRCAEAVARSHAAAVLVTGSMYLAGQVRRRWYRDEDIVLQRTPWPVPRVEGLLSAPRPLRRLECHESDRKSD